MWRVLNSRQERTCPTLSKQYTDEFKAMVVELYKSGKPASEIMREYGLTSSTFYKPKLQLQVEHFGKMATTSGSIKAVEKCIKKFFRGLIAKSLTRTTIQFIGKMQHLVRTKVFNRNALRDILA